jgi:hypothetical protein
MSRFFTIYFAHLILTVLWKRSLYVHDDLPLEREADEVADEVYLTSFRRR